MNLHSFKNYIAYCTATTKFFKGNIIDMLREEIKLNHINYSIKIREGRGEIKYKYEK